MHKVSLALAVVGTSMTLLAQNCNTSPPASSIRTYDPWAASFYYGNLADNTLNQYVDLDVQTPLTVSLINVTTYDQNAGNPVVPDQQGNVAEVRIYTIPGTRVGNEGGPTGWTHVATAELTVVAWNGDSPIQNFKDPITNNPAPFVLPPGQYGMCIEVIPTSWSGTASLPQTNVPLLNPGAIHTIGVSPNPGITWSDQFLTISNDGIQQNGWQTVDGTGTLIPNATPTGTTDSVNIEINYTPDPAAAVSVQYGDGCYDRPQGFLEIIPEASAQGGDLENTGWTFLPQGGPQNSYLVVPGPAYTGPGGGATNLSNNGGGAGSGTFTSSSSASWDDASQTLALGFTFPFPGGSTTDITINSNGRVYLGLTTDGSFATNGSNYGSTATAQNGPPSGPLAQWQAFNCDLDPADPLATGGVYYELLPDRVWIYWHDVPNWPGVGGQLVQCCICLIDSGQVDVSYGSLWNSAVGSGNDAHVGYTNGNGDPISTSFDLSASIGVVTGDGAFPPNLYVDGRPIAGTSVDLVGDNLSPGTGAGFISIGLVGLAPPGFDLSPFGLPGCAAYLDVNNIVTSVFLFAVSSELRWTWNVPTGFNGTQALLQMGTITPGFNAAGVLVTNAVCAKIGT